MDIILEFSKQIQRQHREYRIGIANEQRQQNQRVFKERMLNSALKRHLKAVVNNDPLPPSA